MKKKPNKIPSKRGGAHREKFEKKILFQAGRWRVVLFDRNNYCLEKRIKRTVTKDTEIDGEVYAAGTTAPSWVRDGYFPVQHPHQVLERMVQRILSSKTQKGVKPLHLQEQVAELKETYRKFASVVKKHAAAALQDPNTPPTAKKKTKTRSAA